MRAASLGFDPTGCLASKLSIFLPRLRMMFIALLKQLNNVVGLIP